MPRTKHAVIFAVTIIGLVILLALFMKGPHAVTDTALSVLTPENLFVSEVPTVTVVTSEDSEPQSFRDRILAQLGDTSSRASVVLSEASTPEVLQEPVVTTPIREEFDWDAWDERIPEFITKMQEFDVLLAGFKAQVQHDSDKRAVFLLENQAEATVTPRMNIAKDGVKCLTTEIEEIEKLITILEGTDTAPLGLLYKALIKEIQLRQDSDEVLNVYTQSLAVDANNSALMSAYAETAVNCEPLYQAFMNEPETI